MADPAPIRCAIYTRKSTEEGLEQAFNSLDAQREACASYVASQKHEGWTLVPEVYDDGGFSGGNIERPGLRHLLEDVRAGKVKVIVVYKVDRLTRSLADFAKIVETLDAHGASFVSVTQAFNTTTSMGRLTLNVLLSFAQFEREVTGERIRDKIAASKARGMWMGGVVPLGYEVRDRKLHVIADHADTVRMIFARYLELGSVSLLAEHLAERGIRSRLRVSKAGRHYGDAPFSRGALYLMLQNRLYLGEVTHKGASYPGEHDPIISPQLFEKVAALLRHNRDHHSLGGDAADPSLLVGIVWDDKGRRMTPDHATKRGKRYRYYASRKDNPRSRVLPHRVPAGDLESIILAQLRDQFDDERDHTALLCSDLQTLDRSAQRALIARSVKKIVVGSQSIEIHLKPRDDQPSRTLTVPAKLLCRGRETRLTVAPSGSDVQPHRDPALIKLLLKAHLAREGLEASSNQSVAELASASGYTRDYFGVLLRIAYLAPDIVAAILDGTQPVQLTRQRLARTTNLPVEWQAQREALGFI